MRAEDHAIVPHGNATVREGTNTNRGGSDGRDDGSGDVHPGTRSTKAQFTIVSSQVLGSSLGAAVDENNENNENNDGGHAPKAKLTTVNGIKTPSSSSLNGHDDHGYVTTAGATVDTSDAKFPSTQLTLGYLIVIGCVTLIVMLLFTVITVNSVFVDERFKQVTFEAGVRFRRRFLETINVVSVMAQAMQNFPNMSAANFANMGKVAMKSTGDDLYQVAWAPRVMNVRRAEIEARITAAVGKSYLISTLNATGVHPYAVSTANPVFYPITEFYPTATGGEDLLLVDLASWPGVASAINRTVRTGEYSLSANTKIAHGLAVMFALVPVLTPSAISRGAVAPFAEEDILGYMCGLVNMRLFPANAIHTQNDARGLHMAVFDATEIDPTIEHGVPLFCGTRLESEKWVYFAESDPVRPQTCTTTVVSEFDQLMFTGGRSLEVHIDPSGQFEDLTLPDQRIFNFLIFAALFVAFAVAIFLVAFRWNVLHAWEQLSDIVRSLAITRNEAERANEAKDEFVSYLCHELRNPLHVIIAEAYELLVFLEHFQSSGSAVQSKFGGTTQPSSSAERGSGSLVLSRGPANGAVFDSSMAGRASSSPNTNDSASQKTSESISSDSPNKLVGEVNAIDLGRRMIMQTSSALRTAFHFPTKSHTDSTIISHPVRSRSGSHSRTISQVAEISYSGTLPEHKTQSVSMVGAPHDDSEDDGSDDEDETPLGYVKAILSVSQTMLTIMNDVLDLSKIREGKLRFEEIPSDLKNVVGQVHDAYRAVAQQKNVQLQVNVDDEVPGSLLTDPTRITQLLSNLASNAVKFSVGRSVIIRVFLAQPSGPNALDFRLPRKRDGQYNIAIQVKDTGDGMEASFLPNLFAEFTQAKLSVSREHGGSGLGMSIVKRICDAFGGVIHVESQVGNGTTVTAVLPMRQVTVVQDDLCELPSANCVVEMAPARTRRPSECLSTNEAQELLGHMDWSQWVVLVVDDMGMNRRILKRHLHRVLPHINVLTAANGVEALLYLEQMEIVKNAVPSELRSKHPLPKRNSEESKSYSSHSSHSPQPSKRVAFAFFDVNMPVMCGTTAVEILREHHVTLPCIAVTANAFSKDVDTVLRSGFDAVVTKPFSRLDIANAVLNLIHMLPSQSMTPTTPDDLPGMLNNKNSL